MHGRRAGFEHIHMEAIRSLFPNAIEGTTPTTSEVMRALVRNPHRAQALSGFSVKQIIDKLRAMKRKVLA